jgi:prolyl 4-hydroxylase
MAAADIAQLRARADAGERAAMTAYGKALLAEGQAEGIRKGVDAIARAAALDDGEACAQLAVLAAAGLHGQADWDKAFDLLQRAAELGWTEAQGDLRFLAGAEGSDFAALRARVDIAAWLRPRATTLVRESPRILTCKGFMSHAECDRIVARVRHKMARADVYDPATGASMVAKERSNSKAEIMLADLDLPLLLAHGRISATLGLPSTHFEPTNVLHYRTGEQFKPHYDYLDDSAPGLAADLHQRGQRIVTFLTCLNDGYEGGETAFPRLGYAFKGATGDALMFGNVNAKGLADPGTLHAGLPPTKGDKWMLSQWVRGRPGAK